MSATLVTGAGGFAGSHLVDLLTREGVPVVGWTRQDVDILDRDAVRRAIAELRPARVFHCAGAAHAGAAWTQAQKTLATNVLGTHHVLRGLHDAGLRARVLIPGSAYVYKQTDATLTEEHAVGPASPYALSKLAQEMLGARGNEEDGQQVFLTRSFNHTGPGQDPTFAASGFAKQIALIETGAMPPVIEGGNLETARDMTDVRDTVRAYRDIVEHGEPGAVYNVCSGKPYKIREILDRLIGLSRVPVTIRIDPGRFRPSDIPMLVGSPAKLQHDTGWTPDIPLDQTLSDLLDFWRKGRQLSL